MNQKTAIQIEQLRQMLVASPVSILTSTALAGVLAYMQYGVISSRVVILWFLVVIFIAILRLLLVVTYRRFPIEDISANHSRLILFRTGTLIVGLVWGSSGFLLFPEHNSEHQMFLIYMLAGLSAGGVASFSADLISAAGFSLLVLLPISLRLFIAGDSLSKAMGLAGILYLCFMAVTLRKISRNVTDNILLRLEAGEREKVLIESKERFRTLVEWTPDAIIVHRQGNIIYVNPAAIKILAAKSAEDLLGKTVFSLIHPDYHRVVSDRIIKNSVDGLPAPMIEEKFIRLDGKVIDVEIQGTVINYDGEPAVQAAFRDITMRKEHETELNHAAHFDALTSIPNRALLADRMKHAIANTAREKYIMAVCYLDLDGFKLVNDELGHASGDQVLVEIATRIGNTIRGGDTVARLGGDEFVVLLIGIEKGEECVATVERILAEISEPIPVKGKSVSISASIGVSIYPMDDEDPDTLLRHADHAMYMAKQNGKNCFHIYDPSLDRRARNQHEFLKSIRNALEVGQFELHYQPKVNLSSGKMMGVEALIRWRHPERGLLSPAEFLRMIENTQLDIEIGEWVTATALEQLNRWRSTGLDIEVSINISGYHLETPGFVEKIRQQLAIYSDMPFGKLQIEVLETVAINDIIIVREIIKSCNSMGVGFALDDFGTGYSSLSYLSALPVETLKIDQSFVRDMMEDKGDMAIVQGIIALASAFERQTVAEGIETEAHYRKLLDMGCEVGQGYFIARPMPGSEIINWSKTNWKTSFVGAGIER
jgi:diguanylate cyclase (GGDEF)-like protein/PAS domain S-box-containing protein